MTDLIFFDSDCISAFLWVKEQNLLTSLYPGRIIIPKPAYDELSYHTTPHLKQRIDILLSKKQVKVESINIDSETFNLYQELTSPIAHNQKAIGPGEAASIAMAKEVGGVVASNNLSDISIYLKKYNLKHTTTGDILIEALERGFITEDEGNNIWALMLAKRRRLGAQSFTEYIKLKNI